MTQPNPKVKKKIQPFLLQSFDLRNYLPDLHPVGAASPLNPLPDSADSNKDIVPLGMMHMESD